MCRKIGEINAISGRSGKWPGLRKIVPTTAITPTIRTKSISALEFLFESSIVKTYLQARMHEVDSHRSSKCTELSR
jgi:hypothetical protein